MIRTTIKMLTPFIISSVDVVNGVLLYLQSYCGYNYSNRLYSLLSHISGSSILLIAYVIVNSTHMCKYYKSSCWSLLMMHVFTIIYLYTDIKLLWYIYTTWTICALSLVLWTASILGKKTYNTIHQSCIRSKTE